MKAVFRRGALTLLTAVAAPLLAFVEPPLVLLAVLSLAVAAVYVLLRRRLAVLAPVVFGPVPEPFDQYVPGRYRSERTRTDGK